MSKRTTSSKPESEAPAPRRRAAKPAGEAAPAAPRPPRTRRKTSSPTPVSEAVETAGRSSTRQPTHDEIATRAYFIALERGFSNDPLADWLRAERELTAV
jgi:Protein of unknown function (DUF2934)